jgi:cell division protein FtsB
VSTKDPASPRSRDSRPLNRDRPRLTARAGALVVIVTLLGVLAVVPARAYLDERARLAALELQAQQLEDENDSIGNAIAKLDDPAELERLARECLGMVKPGEIAFVTPGTVLRSNC